ncbi:MAG: peptidoglycan editing factor PgeF [Chloroflexi bacterium]|nr:peptidoglycan editing factor PgeF [Chloroflexota bacterium]
MPFHQTKSILYYTFDIFDAAITQAVFTRQGGISPMPFAALNMSISVDDTPENVDENRGLAFEALGREPASLYDVWQVHGTHVICADAPRREPPIKADAILTDNPAVTLFMRFADCVPILLHDPARGVVGLVHAGWQGTVSGAVRAAVEKMIERYGSAPADIRAGIGPSIGAHHYEVGSEVVARVEQAFGADAESLLPRDAGAVQFDQWQANRLLLEQSGVTQIQISGLCTACDTDNWYSHRAEKGITGRFGALIGLNV